MSLLRPKVEARALSYRDVWGSGGDWQSYKDQGTKALGAVYACGKLISTKVAGCPIEVHRVHPDGSHTRIATPSTFTNPFRRETPFEWKYRAVNALALRGNAYGLAALTGLDFQVGWLDDSLVTVDDAMYPDVAPTYYYRARTLAPADIIHMALDVVPGRVRGTSPIGTFKRTFEAGMAAEKYGSDWFATGGQPSGILKTDQAITDDEAKILKSRWAESRATSAGIAVMGNGAEYQQIQVTAEEAQFIETQRFSVEQVARIFGVPPEMIGGSAGDSLTYANREQRAIDFVTFTLAPYITLLEEHLSRLVPRNQVVVLNTEKLLAGDLQTRLQARAIAIASHQMTPNEARAEEGRQPLTEEQKAELSAVPIVVTAAGKLKDATGPTTAPPDATPAPTAGAAA
jgi:HK97 family phage portal protein